MDYSAEQRAIIARLGEISAEFNTAVARQQNAQEIAGQNMIDAVTALTMAMNQSRELVLLHQRYGDLWHEFLNTL